MDFFHIFVCFLLLLLFVWGFVCVCVWFVLGFFGMCFCLFWFLGLFWCVFCLVGFWGVFCLLFFFFYSDDSTVISLQYLIPRKKCSSFVGAPTCIFFFYLQSIYGTNKIKSPTYFLIRLEKLKRKAIGIPKSTNVTCMLVKVLLSPANCNDQYLAPCKEIPLDLAWGTSANGIQFPRTFYARIPPINSLQRTKTWVLEATDVRNLVMDGWRDMSEMCYRLLWASYWPFSLQTLL